MNIFVEFLFCIAEISGLSASLSVNIALFSSRRIRKGVMEKILGFVTLFAISLLLYSEIRWIL